jgi:hypothetical protein
MPGVSGVTVVINACAFCTPHAAAGASSARHSLRPLISEGRNVPIKLARMRGEIAKLYLDVIARTNPRVLPCHMDCFADARNDGLTWLFEN